LAFIFMSVAHLITIWANLVFHQEISLFGDSVAFLTLVGIHLFLQFLTAIEGINEFLPVCTLRNCCKLVQFITVELFTKFTNKW
jgi:hypothetical protein